MPSIPTLAVPTFMTGVNDALAVADVYDLISPGVITDIESVLSEIADISNALLGSGLMNTLALAESLEASVDTSAGVTSGNPATSSTALTVPTASSTSQASVNGLAGGDAVTTPTLLSRLGTTSSQLNSAIRGLSANAQTTITAGLKNNASSVHEVTLNGVTTQVRSASYSDIVQVAAIVNAFTGSTSATSTDTQAFASIISGIVKICANLGLPNSFSAITSAITDVTILTAAVGLCLEAALVAGDLLSIVAMAQKLSPSVVVQANPNLVSTYVSNFGLSYYPMLGYDTSQANEMLNAVTAALEQIDPTWNQGTRAGTSLTDVTAWMGASPVFTQLLTNAAKQAIADTAEASTGSGLDQTNALAYLFASVFPSMTVIQELEKDYPLVTLTTNEAVAQAVDPSSMLVLT
jgi:hypothetical protein